MVCKWCETDFRLIPRGSCFDGMFGCFLGLGDVPGDWRRAHSVQPPLGWSASRKKTPLLNVLEVWLESEWLEVTRLKRSLDPKKWKSKSKCCSMEILGVPLRAELGFCPGPEVLEQLNEITTNLCRILQRDVRTLTFCPYYTAKSYSLLAGEQRATEELCQSRLFGCKGGLHEAHSGHFGHQLGFSSAMYRWNTRKNGGRLKKSGNTLLLPSSAPPRWVNACLS